YTGRVHTRCDKNVCTLTVTHLRKADSAVYKFRITTNHGGSFTGEPGVTLSVTASSSRGWKELKCLSSCNVSGRLFYVWYKNGQEVAEGRSHSGDLYLLDSYACAVKGYEDFHSPLVYGPKLPSVSVDPTGEIMEGSSVTLSCSSDANPAATYTWYKKDGNPELNPLSKDSQLVFSSFN
ncbi:hypothetical protein LDENG_00210310, partial [Lucifuga dentata]